MTFFLFLFQRIILLLWIVSTVMVHQILFILWKQISEVGMLPRGWFQVRFLPISIGMFSFGNWSSYGFIIKKDTSNSWETSFDAYWSGWAFWLSSDYMRMLLHQSALFFFLHVLWLDTHVSSFVFSKIDQSPYYLSARACSIKKNLEVLCLCPMLYCH